MENRPFTANNHQSDHRDYADSDLEDDSDEITDYDEQSANPSSSDSETEFKGHVYLSDDDDDDDNDIPNSIPTCYTPSSILTPSLFPNVPPYITFASHIEKGPRIPNNLQHVLKWELSGHASRICIAVISNTGFQLLPETDDWIGTFAKHSELQDYQKVNRVLGSSSISRKDKIWRNIKEKIKKFGNNQFGFMAETYIMPEDLPTLRQTWCKLLGQQTKWIVKPVADSGAQGIYLVSKWSEIPHDNNKSIIVQKYVERPLLINETKFDLRIYVLVTSTDPLRVFIYKEGLARFATVKYSNKIDSISNRFMHLTNTYLNRFSENYVKVRNLNSCQGNVWSLTSLWTYLRARQINTRRIWGTIRDLVVRTIIVGEIYFNEKMRCQKRVCYYELFGFDILLDENLTPWLCEVNCGPSMTIDDPLKVHIKGSLIQTVLNTVCFQVPPVLTNHQQNEILLDLNLSGPLSFDRRIYLTPLSLEETRKHKRFTSSDIKRRNDYLDGILEHLTPDDIRCLIIAEDELARCSPMERLFPATNSHKYLQFIDEPRYYNRLLDAWETRYASNREEGIRLLQKFCLEGTHLVTDSDEKCSLLPKP